MNVLSICGSPKKGNSEAIVNRLKQIFKRKGKYNDIFENKLNSNIDKELEKNS